MTGRHGSFPPCKARVLRIKIEIHECAPRAADAWLAALVRRPECSLSLSASLNNRPLVLILYNEFLKPPVLPFPLFLFFHTLNPVLGSLYLVTSHKSMT